VNIKPTIHSIANRTGFYLPIPYVWGSRVVAFQCLQCGTWVRPRDIRLPDGICRDCEHVNEVAAYTTARKRLSALVARARTITGGRR
jgi:hypothetical protein